MSRNWGIPTKTDDGAFGQARRERPVATLGVTTVFGVIGAAVAAISFNDARDVIENVFHGWSLVLAVVAAGVGCWTYVWVARPRFAAHFTGAGDAFSDLLRFYAKAAFALVGVLGLAKFAHAAVGDQVAVLLLCLAGGAGAAAAFQTVLAFVPAYRTDEKA
ncbi:MAG: hypothetical protein VX640_14665 [Pseudomonadota bacterium]|nr:hypothetical protein [Pseudomonadota bacterium]